MIQKIRKASMTAEAALVLPVFLFAAFSIIYINKLVLYEEEVQWALDRVAREASAEYAATDQEVVLNNAYLMGKMNLYLEEKGLLISMLRSRFDAETDELNLTADYEVSIPFPVGGRKFHFTEQVRTRAFTGVLTRLSDDAEEDDITVYITRTGRVYHKSLDCTYLKLHISQVKYGDLEYLRSEGGGKYYPCEGCCRARVFHNGDDVFVCSYGDRFHIRRSCKNIKRSIQEVKLSEAGGRLPCSKCGGH